MKIAYILIALNARSETSWKGALHMTSQSKIVLNTIAAAGLVLGLSTSFASSTTTQHGTVQNTKQEILHHWPDDLASQSSAKDGQSASPDILHHWPDSVTSLSAVDDRGSASPEILHHWPSTILGQSTVDADLSGMSVAAAAPRT
jgi:hypothetical protein